MMISRFRSLSRMPFGSHGTVTSLCGFLQPVSELCISPQQEQNFHSLQLPINHSNSINIECRIVMSVRGYSASTRTKESELAAIRQLRERTGVSIKNVKESLVNSNWDMDLAFTALRKKGLAASSKNKSRVATDGLLGFVEEKGAVAVVEINSETDFVARNEIFQHLVKKVAAASLNVALTESASTNGSATHTIPVSTLETSEINLELPQINGPRLVREAVAEVSAITGENIVLRRAFLFVENPGTVGIYFHSSPAAGLARKLGLVGVQSEASDESGKVKSMADLLAMHVVAMKPRFVSRNLVPKEALDKERSILAAQVESSGKPAAVVEKIVEGRLKKFMEENVLLEQPFVCNEKQKVNQFVDQEGKSIAQKLTVSSLFRLEVGEGIEKVEKDFAAEVLEQSGVVA